MGANRKNQQSTMKSKNPKFELNRKKVRKQKKQEKKLKRCQHRTLQYTEEPKKTTAKITKYTEPHCIVSIQSQEQEIFKNASKTTRISKDEADIANKIEDRIIKDMEKRLGFRRKAKKEEKVPSSLQYDGLGFVLSYRDDTSNTSQPPSESGDSFSAMLSDVEDSNVLSSGTEMDDEKVESDTVDVLQAEAEESDVEISKSTDSDMCNSENELKQRVDVEKENSNAKSTSLYVPVHLRNLSSDDLLRRKIKGLINRVSTSNLKQILENFHSLYLENPRACVNSAVLGCVKEACMVKTSMPARLCAEHMLLMASLSTIIGAEFISPFLESLSEEFEKEINDRHGKLLNNIVAMFCYLYSLKTISCVIIFDIVKKHLQIFSEHDLEILLYIFKSIGIDIRKSDPQALKDIIHCVNEKSSSIVQKSSRFTWFIETITAVKNNNIKKIPNFDKSDIVEIQKCYKAVVKEQPINLQISLQDLLDAKVKGRWWLVGAAWVGNTAEERPEVNRFDSRILNLAKKNHMNTQVRKDIFCTLISSEDYVHCYERIIKLGLKNKQEREVIYVTMTCALKCKSYNQYYTNVIKKFCDTSKNYQITTQFSIWDRLKDLKSLNNRKMSNFCELMVSLIKSKTMSLSVLKVINFVEVGGEDIVFLKNLFTRLLRESEILITEVFGRLQGLPLDSLKNGIKVFMKHFLKNDLSDAELKNMKIAMKCF